jgi:hypothetical protein
VTVILGGRPGHFNPAGPARHAFRSFRTRPSATHSTTYRSPADDTVRACGAANRAGSAAAAIGFGAPAPSPRRATTLSAASITVTRRFSSGT